MISHYVIDFGNVTYISNITRCRNITPINNIAKTTLANCVTLRILVCACTDTGNWQRDLDAYHPEESTNVWYTGNWQRDLDAYHPEESTNVWYTGNWQRDLDAYHLAESTNVGEKSNWMKHFNSLWPSDAIRRQKTESTLAQVMACCLMAPSHYLNQCWFIISKVLWHSLEGIIMRRSEDTNQ